jgi:ketosteroid isomerase-like protein
MSSDNKDLVRRALSAAMRRPEPDWDAMSDLFCADHELRSLLTDIEGTHPSGEKGARDFFEQLDSTGEWSIEIEELRDAADGRVVAFTRMQMRTKLGGVPLEQRTAAICTLRDGRILRTEVYPTRDDALKAAGLDT